MPPAALDSEDSLRRSALSALGEPLFPLVGSHIQRVWTYARQPPPGPGWDLAAAFKRLGLIPDRLTELAGTWSFPGLALSGPRAAPGLSVAFAACAFPNRVSQMGEALQGRAEAFGRFLGGVERVAQGKNDSTPMDIAAQAWGDSGLEGDGAAPDWQRLLADLGGMDLDHPSAEDDSRRLGAALYLTTLSPPFWRNLRAVWPREAARLRAFRTLFPSPPSELAQLAPERGFPAWPKVIERVAKALPGLPEDDLRWLIQRERDVWNKVEAWQLEGSWADAVGQLWRDLWAKLVSGFPFYAFQGSCAAWWKSNLHWPIPPRFSQEQLTLSPQLLRNLREIYRLVRVTFFPIQPGGDPAQANERQRLLLDALWYQRLERKQDPARKQDAEAVKAIGRRFPEVDADTIYTLSARLQARLLAGSLARLRGWSNPQIRSARKTSPGTDAIRYPLKEGPVILLVATLCRTVPASQPLLGPFTAHVFLYPRLRPKNADPWTRRRWVRELWWWLREEDWDPALARGVADESRVCTLIQEAMQLSSPWAARIHKLRSAEDPSSLNAIFAEETSAADNDQAMHLLADWLGHDAAASDLVAALQEQFIPETAPWVLPVWYLGQMERSGVANIIQQLRAEEDEMPLVRRLAQRWQRPQAKGAP